MENDGWYLARTKGSRRQFKHIDKPGTVIVAGSTIEVPIGTLKSIFKQAQLEKE